MKEKLRMFPDPLFSQKMERMIVTRVGDGGGDVFIKGYQVQLAMRNQLRLYRGRLQLMNAIRGKHTR